MNDDGPGTYRVTHNSELLLGIGLAVLLAIVVSLVSIGSNPVLLALGLLVAVAVLLFHSLTITVDEEALEIRVGNGWLRRHYERHTVTGAEIVPISPHRWFPLGRTHGIRTYAVRGDQGVKVQFDDGRCVILGCEDPVSLLLALRPPGPEAS